MTMNGKLICLCLVLLVVSACSTKPMRDQNSFELDYSELVRSEIKKLNDSGLCLKKEITYSGDTEEKTNSNPDWARELRPFLDCDVQKPSFDKLYTSQTNHSGDSTFILYTARGKSSQVRKLEIILLQKNLKRINARIYKKNSYFELAETLEYNSMEGYSIKGSQKMLFASETAYQLKAQFMPCR